MGSDRARNSYNAQQLYRSVVMQQGRVQLEADWNEASFINSEEIRSEVLDIVGPAGTPDNGYAVTFPSGIPAFDFEVTAGTMYVGGERVWAPQNIQYGTQSDWLDSAIDPEWVPVPGESPGNEYVYLVVREQEVSAVEDSELKDVALGGPDTAQRTRLIQHVERLSTTAADCASALTAAAQQWAQEGLFLNPQTMRLGSLGQLQVSFVSTGSSTPCDPTAAGGYLGADNQMIRVQISSFSGSSGTLLWGFDDASFLYPVTVVDPQTLAFQAVPIDAEHQPQGGQWVEVLMDAARLSNGQYVAGPAGAIFQLGPSPYSPGPPATLALPSALTGASSPYGDGSAANPYPPQLYLSVWQQQLPFSLGAPVTLGNTGVQVTLLTQSVPAGNLVTDTPGDGGVKVVLQPASWQANQPYPVGAAILDPASHLQEVTKAGVSGSAAPTFNDTGGSTPNDGTVTWIDQGPAAPFQSTGWQGKQQYGLGELILDPASHIQEITTAGTSGSAAPAFNDSGGTTSDGAVTWTDQGPAAPLHAGDFWTFAVRPSTPQQVYPERYQQAFQPPEGPREWLCPLAVIGWTDGGGQVLADCRNQFENLVVLSRPQQGCCTVTLQPGDINANNTLQNVIDNYQNQQSATVICFAPGSYNLSAPLRFTSAHTNLTLKACESGTVSIRVTPGQEGQFIDGMVVLNNVIDVALRGFYFAVPLTNFQSPDGNFAGVPIQDLPTDTQATISNLVVSIGVRAVNSTGVVIEDCEFGFHDFEEDLPAGAVAFGAGVFATGQCSSWRITNTTFAGVGSFLAGFLLAPSVSFNPPPEFVIKHPPHTLPPLGGFFGEVTIAPRLAAMKTSGVANAVLTESATLKSAAILRRPGPVLNTGSSGRFAGQQSTNPNLAPNGGSVVPSWLDGALFNNNTFSGTTVAVLVLGDSGSVEFLANQVAFGAAGFWLLSPLQIQNILTDPQDLTSLGASIAMGYPLPQGDTSTPVTVPAAPASVLVYTGTSDYNDSQGNVWTPDSSTSGLSISPGTNTFHTTASISGPSDQTLYQSERWGQSFSYTFNNLPSGYYQVTLKFAEISWGAAGQRIFNVSINGTQVLTNFDIFADAGGEYIEDDQVFPYILPAQGQIVVQFTASVDNAKISAVEIDPQWGAAAIPTQQTGAQSFFVQLTALAQQAFATLGVPLAQLRVQDNEMTGLSAPCLLIWGDDTVANANVSSLMMTGNRLNSSITQFLGNQAGAFTAGSTVLNEVSARSAFVPTVMIIQVSQCLVSSNIVTSNLFSFLLNDQLLASPLTGNEMAQYPQLMVMSNLFVGRIEILPRNYPATATQAAPAACRELLNTLIVPGPLKG